LRAYLAEIGCEVVATRHLSRPGPVAIAHTSIEALRDAILAVDGPGVRAIVQFGANLPMARLAARAEEWLGKPVIAINTATYWHALRTQGIADRREGFGRLLAEC
jgi:maleate isomerase